jgi:hypothetical protein
VRGDAVWGARFAGFAGTLACAVQQIRNNPVLIRILPQSGIDILPDAGRVVHKLST